MRTLDRKRGYGVVSGGAAAFEQDGVLFDADGNELATEASIDAEAPAKRGVRRKAVIEDQIAAQTEG